MITNLDPTHAGSRRQDPVDVLEAFPYPLATAEVAAVVAEHLEPPDLLGTETALIAAVADRRAVHRPNGDGALWSPAG